MKIRIHVVRTVVFPGRPTIVYVYTFLSCAPAIFPDAHYHYDRDWRSLNT